MSNFSASYKLRESIEAKEAVKSEIRQLLDKEKAFATRMSTLHLVLGTR